MSNEQLRQRAEALAAEYDNDAYSVALAMLECERAVKAEAVRELVSLQPFNEGCDCDECEIYSEALEYAKELEGR